MGPFNVFEHLHMHVGQILAIPYIKCYISNFWQNFKYQAMWKVSADRAVIEYFESSVFV